jgi:MYXO-CTERM domain-containing protein
VCSPDPCNFVQCPAPCYACDVTSSGQATCKLLQDAAHPQCQVVRVTTGEKGGGCACDVGATSDASSRIALGLGLLGLAMTVRPRRRRRTR